MASDQAIFPSTW